MKNFFFVITIVLILRFFYVYIDKNQQMSYFRSDQQMKLNFKQEKLSFIRVVNFCKSQVELEKKISGTDNHFYYCESNNIPNLDKINMIGAEVSGDSNQVLILSNSHEEGTFFHGNITQEKGYIFSENLINSNLVVEALDNFIAEEFPNDEVWRYRQIEKNWYLYYKKTTYYPS